MKSKDQKRKEALARWEVRKAECERLSALQESASRNSPHWWRGRAVVAQQQIARLRQILNVTVAA